VIGIISQKDEARVVEEFFQLFKTPWEWYRAGELYDVLLVTGDEVPDTSARLVIVSGSKVKRCDSPANVTPRSRRSKVGLKYNGTELPLYGDVLTFETGDHKAVCTTTTSETTGLEIDSAEPRMVRLGYDLFQEIAFLLSTGQPVEAAHIPTLDLHIAVLRGILLEAGIPLLEILPAPAGYDFAVCLTHDIDFLGIRRHKFDHTMWGFLYRSTFGATREFLRRKNSFARLVQTWKAAVSLPFVYLGWAKDFWLCFDWYGQLEKGLSPTYFFIPFKQCCGEKVPASHPDRRASAYDIGDIPDLISRLRNAGCEVGVHGIDSWHSVEKGREELKRVKLVTGESDVGIRMHWLLRDENTYRVLEQAGYSYDSTAGYNETTGYCCGTTQAFRPLSARNLLELPLHIQDGALFYPTRLGLSEADAWNRCERFIANARKLGGVLTILWHDRSPGPERFWGGFYCRLVQKLKSLDVWFGTGGQVVAWFQKRREVKFERAGAEDGKLRIKSCGCGKRVVPPLKVRIHSAVGAGRAVMGRDRGVIDFSWDGAEDIEVEPDGKICGSTAEKALSAAARA
jgi:hypothetical protein